MREILITSNWVGAEFYFSYCWALYKMRFQNNVRDIQDKVIQRHSFGSYLSYVPM